MKVVVIGGGILGASAAWHLRDRAEVTVVDSGQMGGLASRASLGWLNATFYLCEEHFRLRQNGIKAWREVSKILPGLPLSWNGSIIWETENGDGRFSAQELLRWDYRVTELDQKALQSLEPFLTLYPSRAWQLPEEGYVDLSLAADMLLKASGAFLLSGVMVEAIEEKNGRINGVHTNHGTIKSDQVIVAAGTASEGFAASLGIEFPMVERPGLMLTTTSFPKTLSHVCATPDFELLQRRDGKFMLPTSSHQQSMGSEDFLFTPGKTASNAMERLSEYLPHLNFSLEEIMVARRPVPRDELPIIGHAGPEGLYFLTMHSAATLGIIAGEYLVNEILGKDVSNLKPFSPARF